MQRVDNDTFLRQLASLFETSNSRGKSVWLTHKRYLYEGEDAVMEPSESADDLKEYPCLLRASDGDKVKFSTVVQPGQLDKFHATYGALLKHSMPTLRKRDKKKEKERTERIVAKKKRGLDPVIIEGAKRGNGRRKRQRRVKAALKQEESRRKFQEREHAKAHATVATTSAFP